MIKTKVTELLGVKNPIICGTMMALSGPEFTAVCSNAGGLGILASAIYRKPEPLREALQKLNSLAKEPFAVNMNLFPMLKPPNQMRHLKVMIDEGVKIIETSGHEAPEKFLHLFNALYFLMTIVNTCCPTSDTVCCENIKIDIMLIQRLKGANLQFHRWSTTG